MCLASLGRVRIAMDWRSSREAPYFVNGKGLDQD